MRIETLEAVYRFTAGEHSLLCAKGDALGPVRGIGTVGGTVRFRPATAGTALTLEHALEFLLFARDLVAFCDMRLNVRNNLLRLRRAGGERLQFRKRPLRSLKTFLAYLGIRSALLALARVKTELGLHNVRDLPHRGRLAPKFSRNELLAGLRILAAGVEVAGAFIGE